MTCDFCVIIMAGFVLLSGYKCNMQWITLLLCLWCTSPVFSLRISSLLSPEWHSWKAEHTKTYSSFHAELQGHITWKANQALIDAHNSHKEVFGFSLKMNQFGDLVSHSMIYLYLCHY